MRRPSAPRVADGARRPSAPRVADGARRPSAPRVTVRAAPQPHRFHVVPALISPVCSLCCSSLCCFQTVSPRSRCRLPDRIMKGTLTRKLSVMRVATTMRPFSRARLMRCSLKTHTHAQLTVTAYSTQTQLKSLSCLLNTGSTQLTLLPTQHRLNSTPSPAYSTQTQLKSLSCLLNTDSTQLPLLPTQHRLNSTPSPAYSTQAQLNSLSCLLNTDSTQLTLLPTLGLNSTHSPAYSTQTQLTVLLILYFIIRYNDCM